MVTSGYGPRTAWYDTAVYSWFGWIIRRTHGYPVRCPCGCRTGPARESSIFLISYGTHTEPVRDPQGCRTGPLRTRKGIGTTRIGKNPTRATYLDVWGRTGPYGPPRAVHGLFKIPKPVRARELIMHALNSTGPVRGGKIRTVPHGARAGPVSGRTIFVQNSPGTARTGPGSVMWLRHDVRTRWYQGMETIVAVLALCEGNPPGIPLANSDSDKKRKGNTKAIIYCYIAHAISIVNIAHLCMEISTKRSSERLSWKPPQRASSALVWFFFSCLPKQAVNQSNYPFDLSRNDAYVTSLWCFIRVRWTQCGRCWAAC